VAGPIAIRTPVPNTESQVAPAAARAPNDSQRDPFAGVDVSNDSVLRLIAGIEEKKGGRQAAARPASKPPAISTAGETSAQASTTRTEAPEPRRATPAPVPAAVAAPPPNEPATIAAPEPPPTRSGADSSPANAANLERSPAAAPVPAPTAAAASAPDRVLVAALSNATAPPAITAPLKVTNRTVPAFPPEAIRAGVQGGRIVARLTIEADGRVSSTGILSASPIGYFERESRRALSTWRYEPPGKTTSTDIELVFNRE